MKVPLLLALLLLVLAGVLESQSSPTPRPAWRAGYGTINAETGEMTIGRTPIDQKTTATHTVFANTDWNGHFATWGSSSEAADYGILSQATGSKAVMSYQFAYATTTSNPGPITLCNLIYEGYWGNCHAVGLGVQPTGGFCWSGLPGCQNPPYNAWTFTVWSTTTPLWYQDNDPFIHGMVFFDTKTGPMLQYAGIAANGAPDANGQDMFVDSYVPSVTNSTSCFGSWYPFIDFSWHLVIDQVDAAASTQAECNWYCGSGTNSDFFTTYVVREREGIAWQCSMAVSSPHIGAVVAGYLGQLVFPIWGQEGLVDITKPEVMGLPTGYGSAVQITWPVPPNMQYVGYHVFLQSAAFGGGIELSCAYDCTVGY